MQELQTLKKGGVSRTKAYYNSAHFVSRAVLVRTACTGCTFDTDYYFGRVLLVLFGIFITVRYSLIWCGLVRSDMFLVCFSTV